MSKGVQVRLLLSVPICGYGGIGRRVGLKPQCRKACRFESCYPHQYADIMKIKGISEKQYINEVTINMNTIELYTVTICVVSGIFAVILYVTTNLYKCNIREATKFDLGLNLDQLVDLKMKIKAEETKSQEFDSTKSYCEKIQIGAEALEVYKRDNKITLYDKYRMG